MMASNTAPEKVESGQPLSSGRLHVENEITEVPPPFSRTESQSAHVTDPYIVDWEGEPDPENPRNWSLRFKWIQIILVSLVTFVVSLASSMLAPAIPAVMHSLGSNDPVLASFVISIYVIGFALGPLVVAPVSELYGRSIVYQVSNAFYLAFTVGCALSTNVSMFLAFRFLCGCFGIAPLALGGCTIGDLMPPEAMGKPMAIWGLGSLVAPVIAPVAGGYLTEAAGWRWIFWVIVIPMGITIVVSPFLMRETYEPILLQRKAKRLQKSTGDVRYKSRLQSKISQRTFIINTMIRPLKMLCTSPIIMMISADVALVFGYQYLIFTTLSFVFQEQYNFSSGMSGVAFLGNGVGTILGVLIVGVALDHVASSKRVTTGKKSQPEEGLWPLIPGSILVPIGLFWYGWSVQANTHPAVPLVGLGVFGFAVMATLQPVQIYIVSAFSVHAASAMAANNILRNIVGALIPLGGQGLYDALGNGWGNSLLAFIALVFTPIPLLLMKYGERLRRRDRNIQ